MDPSLAKLIDTFTFSKEHDVESLTLLRELSVDELGESHVDLAFFFANVHRLLLLEFFVDRNQLLNLVFHAFVHQFQCLQLSEKVQLDCMAFKHLFFKLNQFNVLDIDGLAVFMDGSIGPVQFFLEEIHTFLFVFKLLFV
jgi:hypothetical protein